MLVIIGCTVLVIGVAYFTWAKDWKDGINCK